MGGGWRLLAFFSLGGRRELEAACPHHHHPSLPVVDWTGSHLVIPSLPLLYLLPGLGTVLGLPLFFFLLSPDIALASPQLSSPPHTYIGDIALAMPACPKILCLLPPSQHQIVRMHVWHLPSWPGLLAQGGETEQVRLPLHMHGSVSRTHHTLPHRHHLALRYLSSLSLSSSRCAHYTRYTALLRTRLRLNFTRCRCSATLPRFSVLPHTPTPTSHTTAPTHPHTTQYLHTPAAHIPHTLR